MNLNLPGEHASRRDDWIPGFAARLANGDIWHIPEARPGPVEIVAGGVAELRLTVGGFPAPEVTEAYHWLDALLSHRLATVPASHFAPPIDPFACTAVGAALLRVNYDVSFVEAMILLRYGFEARLDWNGVGAAIRVVERAVNIPAITRVARTFPNRVADN